MSQIKHDHASRPPIAGWTHINDAIEALLDDLFREVEQHVERTGGFSGPVRPLQRKWSKMLDALEREREENAA